MTADLLSDRRQREGQGTGPVRASVRAPDQHGYNWPRGGHETWAESAGKDGTPRPAQAGREGGVRTAEAERNQQTQMTCRHGADNDVAGWPPRLPAWPVGDGARREGTTAACCDRRPVSTLRYRIAFVSVRLGEVEWERRRQKTIGCNSTRLMQCNAQPSMTPCGRTRTARHVHHHTRAGSAKNVA